MLEKDRDRERIGANSLMQPARGALTMFFLRPSDFDQSMIRGSAAPVPIGILVCPPLFWPPSNQAESWSAIYRLAYEQLVAAFAPSAFQRMIEPSTN